MKCVRITPSKLKGQIDVPSSKSISHRMLICASLAEGESILENMAFSDDITATINGVMALGAQVHYLKEPLDYKASHMAVIGNRLLKINRDTIDCNESGSTLRFLIPLSLLTGRKITFHGRGRLCQRPIDVYYQIFEKQKIHYSCSENGLPLSTFGKLKPNWFYIRGDISSQFISGLLFALPMLKGDSCIIMTTPLESKGYVDLTVNVLERFSVHIENRNYETIYVKGNQVYKPVCCRVEGDYSQGAFWLVAGILGGDITCLDLNQNSLQGDRIIVDILRKMGGQPVVGNDFVKVKQTSTFGVTIDVSQCPDLVPPLAVLGAMSRGTTRIINARRLKIKDSDRLNAMCTELGKLGAHIVKLSEGLEIKGHDMLDGGVDLNSWNDHRIAMALAVAALRCKKPVTIKNSDVVNKSYPAFWEDFKRLGGIIDEFYIRQKT